MEMANDVFPRRNLPDEAEPWGREHDKRMVFVESQIDSVKQSVLGQNRNTASSLSVLGGQIQAIVETQAELRAQQDVLASQQASIIATQNFLLTQTVGDQKSATISGTYTGSASYNYMSLDGTHDCSLSVTTGQSGKLLISVGAAITSLEGSAGVGPEIVGVSLPTNTNSASGSNGVTGASRTTLFTLSPNTTYTVRTRRWYFGAVTQFAAWQDSNITITRLA